MQEFLRIVKFTFCSISAGVIEMGAFALLNELTEWSYWPCYVIALVLSVVWNFTLNRKFTFQSAVNIPLAMAKVLVFYAVFTPATTLLGTFLTEGCIRENITLHPKNQKETRISFRGFTCSEEILLKIDDDIPQNATLVFSGSLPPGITPEAAEAFLLRQKDKGCRLVVDSKSISPAAVRRIRPWLIKPNAEEAEALFGNADWETAALALHREGVENVLVSLGEKGAFLATEDRIFKASAPAILPLSTIGAGDSMIAGFLACNGTPEERLKTAVAYGSAACLTEGTTPPTPDLIQQFL